MNSGSNRTPEGQQCEICGSVAELNFSGLKDRLCNTSEEWSLVKCQNKNCGLQWLCPSPSPEELEFAYKKYYTHSQSISPSVLTGKLKRIRETYLRIFWNYDIPCRSSTTDILAAALLRFNPLTKAYLDSTVMWLKPRINGKVVEIGCGSGWLLKTLQVSGWSALGTEVDPVAVDLCRKEGLDVILGDITDINFPSESFDAVVMSHVIEHCSDPSGVISECFRILKKDGQFVILTPNSDSFGYRMFGRHWLHVDPPRHLRLFNSTNLRVVLNRFGFKVCDSFTTVRDSDWTFGASLGIWLEGTYHIGYLNFMQRTFGRIMSIIEASLVVVRSELGEEVVVRSIKE